MTIKEQIQNNVGREGFEPSKVKTNRFTVCPRWPLEYLPLNLLSFLTKPKLNERAGGGIRTPDQLITNQLLWPTELHRHTSKGLQTKNCSPP